MDAKVTWSQGMSFTGTAGSGFNVPLGSDSSVGGQDDGFRRHARGVHAAFHGHLGPRPVGQDGRQPL